MLAISKWFSMKRFLLDREFFPCQVLNVLDIVKIPESYQLLAFHLHNNTAGNVF